jgi:hypothetical protein
MSTHPTYLEIHVHSVDGHVSAFAQSGMETVQKLIEQMQSGRIFKQPYLAISSHRSLTVFPPAKVVRVDLVMRGFPNWPFHFGIRDAMELSEKEFRLCISSTSDAPANASELRSVYAEIEMTNEEQIYLEIEVKVREEHLTQVDFGMLLQNLLSSPSLHARRLGGGAILINPAHILRLQFCPAPPHPPLSAWSAGPIAEEEEFRRSLSGADLTVVPTASSGKGFWAWRSRACGGSIRENAS